MTDSRFKDHLGRPIIAVTGMGVITSLGQGLAERHPVLHPVHHQLQSPFGHADGPHAMVDPPRP